MTKIILTKSQIEKLYEITQHFQDIEQYEVSTDSSSGIGPTVSARFSLFNDTKMTADITEVDKW